MEYRDILGFSKKKTKKKVVKEQSKPTVTDTLREEFGGKLNEGPSYEYAGYMKNIEKAENQQAKQVNNLVKLLQKKGLKKEASVLASTYMKSVRNFDDFLKKLYRKLA